MKLKITPVTRNTFDVYRDAAHVAVLHVRDNGEVLAAEQRYEFEITIPQTSPDPPEGACEYGSSIRHAFIIAQLAWINRGLPTFTFTEWDQIHAVALRHRF